MDLDEVLAATFSLIAPHLTERQRRRLLGAAARALGDGGVGRVARLAEASRPTVGGGVAELDQPADPCGRIRRHEGPKRRRDSDPGLLVALDRLVDPDTRGDPQSRLRWTCKSTRELAEALTAQGHPVSDDTVGRLLREQGYRLQRTAKTLEAPSTPTGTPSFAPSTSRRRSTWPAGSRWSVWTPRNRELVGNVANGGAEWQPSGEPERVNVDDVPDPKVGKAIPYGVDDLGHNTSWVGVDHDTAAFAVRRCGAGGSRSAGPPTRGRTGCWSVLMLVVPTATGSGRGRPSWPGSRPRPDSRSPSATCRQGPPSATGSSIGCAARAR